VSELTWTVPYLVGGGGFLTGARENGNSEVELIDEEKGRKVIEK
jgi:hypothetical protein